MEEYKLETNVVGTVGTGVPWSQPRGGGGAEGTGNVFFFDTRFQETILGTSVGEQMCVADTRLVSAELSPLVAPHTLWGCDALNMTYDPVRSNAGPVVRRQKHLYDPQAVKRIDTSGPAGIGVQYS